MDNILEIKNLKKTYRSNFLIRSFPALKGIDLQVERGGIYGFLGPNGSGKTTTIKCIFNLIRPDSGTILVDGQPTGDHRLHRKIGYLPENPYFYDYLTTSELLLFSGRLCGKIGRAHV